MTHISQPHRHLLRNQLKLFDPTGIIGMERDTSKVKFWHGDAPPIFNLDGVPGQCMWKHKLWRVFALLSLVSLVSYIQDDLKI